MKIFTLSALPIAIALAGCESSPKQVVEEGQRFTGQIAGDPLTAARCVARNAEFNLQGLVVGLNPLQDGSTEVTIRVNGMPITHSVWRFTRGANGSIYEVWVNPPLINKEGHIREVRGAC